MESNSMLQELIQAHKFLSSTATITKNKFDAKMRATVKDLISHHYALKVKSIDIVRQKRMVKNHFEVSEIIGDRLFGMDTSKKLQFQKNGEEQLRTRPYRIYTYIQKLVDIFPVEHLTKLLRDSLSHTPEETILLYEANKGEAQASDYYCEPTQIDPTALKNTAELISIN